MQQRFRLMWLALILLAVSLTAQQASILMARKSQLLTQRRESRRKSSALTGCQAYPSTIVTGGSVTDASGFVYNLAPGEFVFPIMFPGDYRLIVTPPAGYAAPSLASPSEIACTAQRAVYYHTRIISWMHLFLMVRGTLVLTCPLDPSQPTSS